MFVLHQFKNSLIIHEQNTKEIIAVKESRFLQNFCLDFLGLYNIYRHIKNSFVNKVTRWYKVDRL